MNQLSSSLQHSDILLMSNRAQLLVDSILATTIFPPEQRNQDQFAKIVLQCFCSLSPTSSSSQYSHYSLIFWDVLVTWCACNTSRLLLLLLNTVHLPFIILQFKCESLAFTCRHRGSQPLSPKSIYTTQLYSLSTYMFIICILVFQNCNLSTIHCANCSNSLNAGTANIMTG